MKQYLYRCEARNIDGFLSQLIRYVSSGHYFYITGRIPERKDPAVVDAKLINRTERAVCSSWIHFPLAGVVAELV